MSNFAVLTIAYLHTATAIVISITTNTPCHLTCYYTDKEPRRHRTARNQRGLTLPWGVYYCFVAWQTVEQTEPGDTYIHTFEVAPWEYCQTKWFAFRGTLAEVLSPSVSPLFKHHHHYITYSQEQLLNDFFTVLHTSRIRCGQRLIIPGRSLTHLSFLLYQYTPGATGPVTFEVWADIPEPTIVATKFLADASALPLGPTWQEVALDSPVFVDGPAHICVQYPGPGHVGIRFWLRDVKPDEYYAQQAYPGFAWWYITESDMAYKYTYQE